ncbi:MAG TPA: LysM domain-containing protein [Anaeromyxobacteraceae bacterium]|nr:LysM domain-containing protein [Anaeromyxobacteraceae bacterium]
MRACRFLYLLALVPLVALAQSAPSRSSRRAGQPDKAQELSEGPEASEDADEMASPDANKAEPAQEAAASANAPREDYTVKPGDTLWDLSGRFLNNPWYWPKVWSYNPEITNPHFIYPGNLVRLYPGSENGPVRLAPVDRIATAEEDYEAPRELDDLSRADMKKPQDYGDGDEVAVVGPYRIGYVAPKGVYARHDTFVTERELAESGVIKSAFADKVMLSLHDRAYVVFKNSAPVKKGELYTLYRTERPVKHPVTGELYGYQSLIIGTGRVVSVDDKAVTVEIAQAFDSIERGDYVGPWNDHIVKQVRRRPNAKDLQGYIIAARESVLSELGEHHVVFIDKGRADGVEEGNVFSVVRSGDPLGRTPNEVSSDPQLPTEDLGSLLVVDAQQTSSAALVVRSLRELYVGDRVEMHAGAAKISAAGGS